MYVPIFLELAGVKVAVVGGSPEGWLRARQAYQAGATVRVIAPALCAELAAMIQEGHAAWVDRGHRPGDLAGCRIAFCVETDPGVREQVWRDAGAAGCLLNTMDDPAHCHFIMPAVVRRADLTIAVSTQGKSPAVARKIREEVEARYGDEYGVWLDLIGRLRNRLRRALPGGEARRRVFQRVVADSATLELIREARLEEAQERAERLVAQELAALHGGRPDH